jgi:signal transduction histidine kinase
MKERIELVGGRFSLTSTPGTGTHIQVTLALPPVAAPVGQANS